mgnify:CR=1 FL=1
MDAVLFVAAGGALGALCRYFTGMAAAAVFGPFFPVGTLIVNIVGCFVIGSVYASQPSGLLGEFILQGFCGALTTFSTCAQSCRQRAFEHGARARSRGARSVALQRGVAAEADGNPARGVFPAEERRKRAVGDTRNINNNPMNAGKETCRSLQDR